MPAPTHPPDLTRAQKQKHHGCAAGVIVKHGGENCEADTLGAPLLLGALRVDASARICCGERVRGVAAAAAGRRVVVSGRFLWIFVLFHFIASVASTEQPPQHPQLSGRDRQLAGVTPGMEIE